jgi:hypothetical protein
MLRKLTAAALVGAVVLAASLPASALVPPPPPPPPPPPAINHGGTSGAAGAGAVTGFIGFVAAIVTYDLIRRTTCSGDFLGLGGPGFTTPITPASGNVMIPRQCVVKQAVVRARG